MVYLHQHFRKLFVHMSNYIIADNQDITRAGLFYFIDEIDPQATFISASSCSELRVILNAHPDSVVIVDYTCFDFTSVDQLLNMVMGAKSANWLLFSEELSEDFLSKVLISAPEVSIVMKMERKNTIINALQQASKGNTYRSEIAESALKKTEKKPEGQIKLTASEQMVLHEISLGKTTKEIAYEKNLSFHTINTHRKNIFRKLQVNNVHEARKYALRAGLIDFSEYYI